MTDEIRTINLDDYPTFRPDPPNMRIEWPVHREPPHVFILDTGGHEIVYSPPDMGRVHELEKTVRYLTSELEEAKRSIRRCRFHDLSIT